MENSEHDKQIEVSIPSNLENKEDSVSVGDCEENESMSENSIYSEDLHLESDEYISESSEYLAENATEIPESIRKSGRTPKPKNFDDYVTYLCLEENPDLENPMTFQDALSRPDGGRWQEAISKELQSFEEIEAWELVDLPESGSVVECKWVFRKKVDSDTNVTYRARLVANQCENRNGRRARNEILVFAQGCNMLFLQNLPK
ncbi:hypothetical protein JTB14_003190 [Gonioctena quinquepunctata]|nr:hypothetical protein JTB14_003190 [Gonioctena quinquepunctata]